MSIWRIVFKSLRQHALSTTITALCIALAGGLLMSVWAVKEQSQATFTGVNAGFDAVLGARGSKLQLVLNAIFHVEASPGNLAWADYLDIQKNPNVELAVPIAVGDNYRGYRLVGTTLDLFNRAEYAAGKRFAVASGGRLFEPTLREAVVGSFAAHRLGLKPGDRFHPFHGLIFDEKNQHSETYVVVGVLEPSNTPADRVIWIPLAGIQKMSGHDPNAATDVSAVLVKLKAGSAAIGFQLDLMYNKQGNRLTFAWPVGRVMAELFDKIGWFDRVLALVSYLVALVATASILASIYNSMNERRREIAILRALGARRMIIFRAILLEAASISALGMLLGFIAYFLIMLGVTGVIRAQTGVVLQPFKFNPIMLIAPVALIMLGAMAGLVPALKAYRTDVAENPGARFLVFGDSTKDREPDFEIKEMKTENLVCAVLVLGLLNGCGKDTVTARSAPGAKHEHKPPHGGTAVVLGNEEYHLELVRDAAAGKLGVYVMDGELENFVRIRQESFEITTQISGAAESLRLLAVANPATGETVGDTSLFEAGAEWLKTATNFDATLRMLTVRGNKYENVAFNFPKGNDTDENETK